MLGDESAKTKTPASMPSPSKPKLVYGPVTASRGPVSPLSKVLRDVRIVHLLCGFRKGTARAQATPFPSTSSILKAQHKA